MAGTIPPWTVDSGNALKLRQADKGKRAASRHMPFLIFTMNLRKKVYRSLDR